MNQRLLLIEDETTLSLLLRERLEREGFSVETCTNGEQGLTFALKGGFDILLLDIKLPAEMDLMFAVKCGVMASMFLS